MTGSGERRLAILGAARRALAEGVSPANLTLAEVARRAGVTRTTVYRYFRDRAALYEALGDVETVDLEATRQAILAAGLRCVARWGIRGATMARIGREAGVSPASIYWYYPSKEELIAALLEANTPLPELRQLSQLPIGAEREQLLALGRRVLALFDERYDIIKTVITEGSSRPDMVDEFYQEVSSKLIAHLSAYFDKRVAAGVFRPGPSFARAMAFVAPIFLYTFARRNLGETIALDSEAAAAEFAAILHHGIASQTSPTPLDDGSLPEAHR